MAVTKKNRFEVFKRDKFICQYCGAAAPDVVLQVDHIHPVSKGGTDDALNLITSCFSCNQGKKARTLSDSTVITKQKEQLDMLQERREQLELMIEWQRGLNNLNQEVEATIAEYWKERCDSHFFLNETGLSNLRKLLKRFSSQEIVTAITQSTDHYLEYDKDGKPTAASVDVAFNKIGGICVVNQRSAGNEDVKRLYYIKGILKRKLSYMNESVLMGALSHALESDVSIDWIENLAHRSTHWSHFTSALWSGIEHVKSLNENKSEDDAR